MEHFAKPNPSALPTRTAAVAQNTTKATRPLQRMSSRVCMLLCVCFSVVVEVDLQVHSSGGTHTACILIGKLLQAQSAGAVRVFVWTCALVLFRKCDQPDGKKRNI